jgi:hypothetical protein
MVGLTVIDEGNKYRRQQDRPKRQREARRQYFFNPRSGHVGRPEEPEGER